GTVSFGTALPNSIGIGDAIQYDSTGDSTIDSIAFISRRISSTEYRAQSADGGLPNAVTGDQEWEIYRSYSSLENALVGTVNSGISGLVSAQVTGGNRDLVANEEQWNIVIYAD